MQRILSKNTVQTSLSLQKASEYLLAPTLRVPWATRTPQLSLSTPQTLSDPNARISPSLIQHTLNHLERSVQISDPCVPDQLNQNLWGWTLSSQWFLLHSSLGTTETPTHARVPDDPSAPRGPKPSRRRGRCRPARGGLGTAPLPSREPEPGARPSRRVPASSLPCPHPKPFSSLLQIAAKEAEGTGGGNG